MSDLEKLQNAYWRMDDALDNLCLSWEKAPKQMREVWEAHKLLHNIIKEKEFETETPTLPEWDGNSDYSQWLVANNMD